MKTTRWFNIVIALTVMGALLLAAPFTARAEDPAPTPTLTTDKPVYDPGEIVIITGNNFAPGVKFAIPVIRPDGVIAIYTPPVGQSTKPTTTKAPAFSPDLWEIGAWAIVTADATGKFVYEYDLNGVWGAYEIRAYPETWAGDLNIGPIASVWFVDGDVDFRQCANGKNGMEPCSWINSILNANNSEYFENMGVPQQAIFEDIPATTDNKHWLTFGHEATKASAGSHAYDWLVSYDQANVLAEEAAVPYPDLWTMVCTASTPTKLQPICNALKPYKLDKTVNNLNCYPVEVPQDGYPSKLFEDTSGSYQDRIDAFEGLYGNRTITVCGNQPMSGFTLTLAHTETDDSSASDTINYELKWTGATTNVAVFFAGHLASSAKPYPGWGMPRGSANINGGPYHIYLYKLDGASLGKQDNQIQGSEIKMIKAKKSGHKWNDVNANGVWDTGELGLSGWTIYVDYNDNNIKDTGEPFAVTDTTGYYQITAINAGTWKVKEVAQAGWNCSFPNPCYHQEVFADGLTFIDNNFGNYQGRDLTVSKTAVPSFTRTYSWEIYKNVNKTLINIPQGGSATFNYTVGVTHTFVDSEWKVAGKIKVTNPNAFAVTGVDITDSIDHSGVCTVIGGSGVTVPANSFVEKDYECTFTSAPGSGTNTATATWDAAVNHTPTGSASGTKAYDFSTVTPKIVNPSVVVIDPIYGVDPLGTVTYTDPSPKEFKYSKSYTGVDGSCKDYDNTASITYKSGDPAIDSASQTVKVCVGLDLTVSKTAAGTFDRLYKWKIDKSVDDTRIEIAAGGKATFNYSVKVTPDGYVDSGWTLSGKITVSNPNDWEDITTTVTDATNVGGTCTVVGGVDVVIPAGESKVFDYSCAFTIKPSNYTGKNTATATWVAATYFTPSSSASGQADIELKLKGETNKVITVIDDKTDPAKPITLGTWNWADGEHNFTYSLDKVGVDGKCTDYTNTAVIDETKQSDTQTVTVCVGKDLTVSKTAAGTFNRKYNWKIDKSVDDTLIEIAAGGKATFTYTIKVEQTGIEDSGWTLSGKITITNPNDWEDITLTNLVDVVDNDGSCTVAPGPYVIPKSGSLDVNYSCSYAAAPSSYSGKNTATATWDAAKYFTPNGSASGSADFTLAQLGSTNKTVTVTDTLGGNLGTVTATNAPPYASGTFTYQKDFAGVAGTCKKYDNTATIVETGQSDKVTVEVCTGLDLTVTKTAAGTFNREYLWDITKSVNVSAINIPFGETATFNYTVNVFQTGIEDSGWTLSGKITITNPNDWEAITLTNLVDVVDNGGSCTVAPGPYVIPKSGSLDVNYSCSYAAAPTSYSGKNTATANWNAATYFTPTGTASGSADFTLAQLGSTNKTVHVTDSQNGDLGTVTATDAPPYASGTFKYSTGFKGEAGKCLEYDNIATIVDTKDDAKQTVKVCTGVDLTVTKTAAGIFNRKYNWTIYKSVDDTRIEIAFGGKATFNYLVNVEQTGIEDSGWTLSGKITLTNLVDVVDNGGVCTVAPGPYVIPKSGSLDVNYSCSYAAAPSSYSGKNTATATWEKALYFTPTGSASGEKAFTLTQLGSTNKTVTVTDTLGGNLGTVTAKDAAPWATKDFTYSYEFSGVAGTCKEYDNTATITETGQNDKVTVEVCTGVDLKVTKTAAGTYNSLYKWLIDKSVDDTRIEIAAGGKATFNYSVKVTPDGYVDSGWTLAGKITVTNPNDWEAITADVTDAVDIGGGAVCSVTGGDDVIIPAKGSVELPYSCTFTGKPAYTGKNTATATWDKDLYFTPTGSASGNADVALTLKGETNKVITVIDDKTDPANPITLGTWNWADGEHIFTYSLEKLGVAGKCTDYTNTAVIDETEQSDTQKVTVCVGKDLTVTKTAAGTFDREYLWKIEKLVDKTHVDTFVGEMVTFNYTVKVTQTGIKDSGWYLGGKITVTNPNEWEDITTTVTDTTNVGGTCTVVGGANVVIPAGQSVEFNYSCSFATKPSNYTGVNTAKAAWNKTTYFTPAAEATGTAPFTLTQADSINKTVHVTDTYAGALGTVTATDTSPWASATFTYSRVIEAKFGCFKYDNTATITETDQKSSVSVEVCGLYWAFTPGFWKNHIPGSPSGHDAWQYTEYTPDVKLISVFLIPTDYMDQPLPGKKYADFGDASLLDALSFQGGGTLNGAAQILFRAGVASLLNASFHEVMGHPIPMVFPYTSAEIIAMVNKALADAVAAGDPSILTSLAATLDMYNNGIHYIDWTWTVPPTP